MDTIRGSDANEVVRQVEEMLGDQGSHAQAVAMVAALGGASREEGGQALVLSYTQEQWDAAIATTTREDLTRRLRFARENPGRARQLYRMGRRP